MFFSKFLATAFTEKNAVFTLFSMFIFSLINWYNSGLCFPYLILAPIIIISKWFKFNLPKLSSEINVVLKSFCNRDLIYLHIASVWPSVVEYIIKFCFIILYALTFII